MSRDFPDYDSDATDNFYSNFPDEDPILVTWNTNEKHLSDTSNKKLSLPDNNSICDLFPNFIPCGSK